MVAKDQRRTWRQERKSWACAACQPTSDKPTTNTNTCWAMRILGFCEQRTGSGSLAMGAVVLNPDPACWATLGYRYEVRIIERLYTTGRTGMCSGPGKHLCSTTSQPSGTMAWICVGRQVYTIGLLSSPAILLECSIFQINTWSPRTTVHSQFRPPNVKHGGQGPERAIRPVTVPDSYYWRAFKLHPSFHLVHY